MFFARSVLSSTWAWLKLPAGSSLPGSATGGVGGPPMPKRSRLFTAAVLAVAAALLLLPEGRDAIRTVTASWLGFVMTDSDDRTLSKLAARAEDDKDVATLAFVALSPARDATRAKEKRISKLVEETVALDPSFIWIYGAKNHRPDFYPAQEEWLKRLQAADPENAVPLLLEADALAGQKISTLRNDHRYPTEKDLEKLGDDSEWMGVMGRACAMPKYDSYFSRHQQLMRTVWDRDPSLPPEIFLDSLWSHAMPDLHLLRIYTKVKLDEADKARASSDFKQAEAMARGVAAFGARMMTSSGAVIEELIAVAISRMADNELAAIYAAEGKTAEAQKAIAHSNELEQTVKTRFAHDAPGRVERIRTLHREAALVQGFAILGGIALVATVVGVLLVELWPGKKRGRTRLWRRALCFAADWAPTTLLIASGAFLASFLPFRRVFADFRISSYQLTDEQRVTDAVWGLVEVPQRLLGYDAAVSFWSALIVALSALAVSILAWSIYRARRVASRA